MEGLGAAGEERRRRRRRSPSWEREGRDRGGEEKGEAFGEREGESSESGQEIGCKWVGSSATEAGLILRVWKRRRTRCPGREICTLGELLLGVDFDMATAFFFLIWWERE